MQNKFRSCNDSDFKLYLSHHPVSESMYREPISTNEILDIIAKLNNNKSPGPDMITPYLFKDIPVFHGKTNISCSVDYILNSRVVGVMTWMINC